MDSRSSNTPNDNDSGKDWREELSTLQSLLNSDEYETACTVCLNLLGQQQQHHAASTEEEGKGNAIPVDVVATVQVIYVRCLLKQGLYQQVIDYSRQIRKQQQQQLQQEREQADSALTYLSIGVKEEAYSLYRLGRYNACRTLCESFLSTTATNKDCAGNNCKSIGLLQIYAQTLFRLNDTNKAIETYETLLSLFLEQQQEGRKSGTAVSPTEQLDSKELVILKEEKEEIWTNLLATHVANKFYYCSPSTLISSSSSSALGQINLEETILTLLSSSTSSSSSYAKTGEDTQYNYDLAYNLATFLILTSSTSIASLTGSLRLLEKAEEECVRINSGLSSSSRDDDDDDDDDDVVNREVNPIRAQRALCLSLLGGGVENRRQAKSICNDLLLLSSSSSSSKDAHTQKSKKIRQGGKGGGPEDTAANNLTVLNVGTGTSATADPVEMGGNGTSRETLIDSFRRLPDVLTATSPMGKKEEEKEEEKTNKGEGGGKKGYYTPTQVRIILWNRALLLLRMNNKGTECREALSALRASVTSTCNESGSAASAGGGGGDSSKRKKKKKTTTGMTTSSTTTSSSGTGIESRGAVPSAPPTTRGEMSLWLNRITLVESELLRKENRVAEADQLLVDAIAKTQDIEGKFPKDNVKEREVLDYTLAEVLLYRYYYHHHHYYQQQQQQHHHQNSKGDSDMKSKKDLVDLLKNQLPASVSSRPAVIATMAALYESMDMSSEASALLSSSMKEVEGGGASKKKAAAMANYKLSLGSYREAAELYESILNNNVTKGKKEKEETDDEQLVVTAGLVKALSHVDPERAIELAGSLPSLVEEKGGNEEGMTMLDGEALEEMEIPRLAISRGGIGGSGGSRIRKLIAVDRARGTDRDDRKKKKNREAVLRQRARKRELYLQKLREEGRYNPDRPAKPDPERWIPKNQRSYAKRGRRGRHKFVGAQGVGAGAGAEKDAAKLDAAARAAARAAGTDVSSSKPSTAHIDVSGSGGRRGGRRR